MEAFFGALGGLLKELGKAVFPVFFFVGLVVALNFTTAQSLFAPLVPADKLKAYTAAAILFGGFGSIGAYRGQILNAFNRKIRTYKRQQQFRRLPLDAKFAVYLVISGHERQIVLPELPNAVCNALVDAGYGYINFQGPGYVRLDFYDTPMPYLRKQRARLQKVCDENETAFASFCDHLIEAIKARQADPNAWMQR